MPCHYFDAETGRVLYWARGVNFGHGPTSYWIVPGTYVDESDA